MISFELLQGILWNESALDIFNQLPQPSSMQLNANSWIQAGIYSHQITFHPLFTASYVEGAIDGRCKCRRRRMSRLPSPAGGGKPTSVLRTSRYRPQTRRIPADPNATADTNVFDSFYLSLTPPRPLKRDRMIGMHSIQPATRYILFSIPSTTTTHHSSLHYSQCELTNLCSQRNSQSNQL